MPFDPRRPSKLIDLADVAVPEDTDARARHFIKESYTARDEPRYFIDSPRLAARLVEVIWQPDVYSEAARLAHGQGATRIVDIGCGDGSKLAALYPRLEVTGLDYGPNLKVARRHYPFGEWLEHDLSEPGPLPVPEEKLAGAVLVCSDVIEHLVDPALLLKKLGLGLSQARGLVLSTPDRELNWGASHSGPPPNAAHIREWSAGELAALLADAGFRQGWVGHTRAHNLALRRKTIVAVVMPSSPAVSATT